MNIRSELSTRASKSDTVAKRIISSITSSSNRSEQSISRQNIITSLPKATLVNQTISTTMKMSAEKVKQVSSSIASAFITKKVIVETIAKKNNISTEKTTQIINSLNQNINTPVNKILEKVSTEVKMDKSKVTSVIKDYSTQVKLDTKTVKEVAKQQATDKGPTAQISEEFETVKKKLTDQYDVASEPEKNIEKTVVLPPTVSIDEYENVKKMWKNQYEKGDVLVTENIKDRDTWIEKDIVFITNTLNKLLASEDEIKQQGLDEVGYILPIFLVNNLSGEQLVAYLKAKIEAAKEVKELRDREKEITERLKVGADEELVDVAKPKAKEEEKTMEMKEELKIKN
jgi:hypothetical protein